MSCWKQYNNITIGSVSCQKRKCLKWNTYSVSINSIFIGFTEIPQNLCITCINKCNRCVTEFCLKNCIMLMKKMQYNYNRYCSRQFCLKGNFITPEVSKYILQRVKAKLSKNYWLFIDRKVTAQAIIPSTWCLKFRD